MVASVELPQQRRIGTSLVGVVLGTGTIVLAQSMDPGSNWSKFLMYCAPPLGIAGDWLSAFIYRSWNRRQRRRDAAATLEELGSMLENPHTDADHKTTVQAAIQQVERARIDELSASFLNSADQKVQVSNKAGRPRRIAKPVQG